MADVKITDYNAIAALADADLIEVVDDVAGTPTSKKSTWTTVKAFLKTYFDGLYAGKGVNSDITSMTGLNNNGIPLAKVANAASDGANSDITSLDAFTGGQIAFPATAVPSAGANTLDDYEEGSWTPDLQFGGAKVGITYTTQNGDYLKIGNRVFFNCYVLLSSKGTSVGNATLYGLPFTSINNATGKAACTINLIDTTFANVFMVDIIQNVTYLRFMEITEAGAWTPLNNTNFTNISHIRIQGVYKAA